MKNTGRINFFVKCTILTVICFCVITTIQLKSDYNNLKLQAMELQNTIEQKKDEIEEIERQISSPFDEDYIIRIAREKLNYCMPDEIIFYNDR